MLSVEDWAEIRRLHRAEGMPIKVIARVMGCLEEHGAGGAGRDGPPRYERAPAGSIVDEVEPRIRELLQAYPDDAGHGDRRADRLDRGRSGARGAGARSCGRCICRRTRRRGRPMWPGRSPSATCGSRRSSCRSGSARPAPPTQLPVLTMVSGYSRWLSARADPDPDGGGPVRRLVAAASRRWGRCRGCWSGTARARSAGGAAGAASSPRECQAFRGTLGTKVLICRPADPEAKGLVERAHDYLERSFLPGRSLHLPGRLQHPAAATGWRW